MESRQRRLILITSRINEIAKKSNNKRARSTFLDISNGVFNSIFDGNRIAFQWNFNCDEEGSIVFDNYLISIANFLKAFESFIRKYHIEELNNFLSGSSEYQYSVQNRRRSLKRLQDTYEPLKVKLMSENKKFSILNLIFDKKLNALEEDVLDWMSLDINYALLKIDVLILGDLVNNNISKCNFNEEFCKSAILKAKELLSRAEGIKNDALAMKNKEYKQLQKGYSNANALDEMITIIGKLRDDIVAQYI